MEETSMSSEWRKCRDYEHHRRLSCGACVSFYNAENESGTDAVRAHIEGEHGDDGDYQIAALAFEPTHEEAEVALRIATALGDTGHDPPSRGSSNPITRDEVHAHMRAEAEAKKLDSHVANALNVAAQVVGAAMQKALDRNKRRMEQDQAPPSVGNVATCHRCSAPTHLQHRNRPTCRPCADLLDARRPDDVEFDHWMFMRAGPRPATVEELKALLPAPLACGDLVSLTTIVDLTMVGVVVELDPVVDGSVARGWVAVRTSRGRTTIPGADCTVLEREQDR